MSLFDRIGVKAGDPLTAGELEELKKAWREVYLVFNLCMAPSNPIKRKLLEELKSHLMEANELIMSLEV
ncbi:hypothetical protein ES703_09066 [subsurface metagenome]